MKDLVLSCAPGSVVIRASRHPISPDAILIFQEGKPLRISRLIAHGCLEAVVDAVNNVFISCLPMSSEAPNRVDVHPHLFERLCDEANDLQVKRWCPRCGGTKEDPEHSGPCGECFERPAPPSMPRELREAYGRDAMLVQLDWLRSVGDAKGEAEAMRRLALWNRPQEEWELDRPVLLRGAYRTPGEADIELSWRVYYAGRRLGESLTNHHQDIIDSALRMLGDSPLRAAEVNQLRFRAAIELRLIEELFRTPTQIAARMGTWMMHPRRSVLTAQAAAEREAIIRRAEQLRVPWDHRIGFTFLGGPR